MGYCEGVLEAVERRAKGRPVSRIGVRIGAVHRVVPDVFEQSFQLAAVGGPAEGACTEVTVQPVEGHCMDCRHDFSSLDPAPSCPSCGSIEVAAHGGDEVVLEWVAYVDSGAVAAAATEGNGAVDHSAETVPPHIHGAETRPPHTHGAGTGPLHTHPAAMTGGS